MGTVLATDVRHAVPDVLPAVHDFLSAFHTTYRSGKTMRGMNRHVRYTSIALCTVQSSRLYFICQVTRVASCQSRSSPKATVKVSRPRDSPKDIKNNHLGYSHEQDKHAAAAAARASNYRDNGWITRDWSGSVRLRNASIVRRRWSTLAPSPCVVFMVHAKPPTDSIDKASTCI